MPLVDFATSTHPPIPTQDAVQLQELLHPADSPRVSISSSDLDHLLSEDDAASETASEDEQLPPADGGLRAWTFLAAIWLIEAMIWGFALAFGVFQVYYPRHPLFEANPSIPTIGTLATGTSYLAMPLTNAAALRWPRAQRPMCLLGWALCVSALVTASFATTVAQLWFTQGLLYGFGWALCYTPFLHMLNTWFVRRRGLAYGVLFAASGVSGLAIPLAIGALLARYDFRVALRVFAAATVVVSGPGFLLVKPRFVQTRTRRARSKLQAQYRREREGGAGEDGGGREAGIADVLTDMHFWVFAAAVFVQGLAFFVPNVFLPSYATALRMSDQAGEGLLALNALAQVAGQIFLGWLSDRTNPYISTTLSAGVSALAAYFIWGPAKDFASLAVFAMAWGFFSGSYSVLYTSVCKYLTSQEELGMIIYGIFSFERGVSNVLEGPISMYLMGGAIDRSAYGLGRYTSVVRFSWICMAVSALGILGMLIPRKR